MTRVHVAIAGTMALLAFCVPMAIATAATEKTKILPEPTEAAPDTFTAKSGAGEIEAISGKKLECTKDAGTGTFTNANLGYGKTLFEGCTSELGSTCTGEGDSSGTIETRSTIHYVLALKMLSATTSTLVPAFALLFPQFHFTCSVLTVKLLMLWRGCVAAVEDSEGKLTKNVRLLFEQYATGENKILSILMENNTKAETKCLLETSITEEPTGEKFELTALIGEAVLEKWHQNGVEIEILLMD